MQKVTDVHYRLLFEAGDVSGCSDDRGVYYFL